MIKHLSIYHLPFTIYLALSIYQMYITLLIHYLYNNNKVWYKLFTHFDHHISIISLGIFRFKFEIILKYINIK